LSRPLTVASVIEKNKVVSDTAFLVLLDISVIDPNTAALIEKVYIAQNDENVVFNGNVYAQANFNINFTQNKDEEPTVSLAIQDQTGVIAAKMDAYAGGAGFGVTMTIVNSARLDEPPEMQETFTVTGASVSNYVATFVLGSESLLGLRWPPTNQFRDRCRYRYKSGKCAYTGSMPSCDYTYDGANGCKAHGNELNYGGFRGLRPLNIS